jgi:hypothetical protein
MACHVWAFSVWYMTLADAALKTAEYHFQKGAIADAMKAIAFCMKQKKRPSTALRAAEIVLRHEVDILKYENPPLQKSEIEHKGLPDIPNELTIKIVDSK